MKVALFVDHQQCPVTLNIYYQLIHIVLRISLSTMICLYPDIGKRLTAMQSDRGQQGQVTDLLMKFVYIRRTPDHHVKPGGGCPPSPIAPPLYPRSLSAASPP